MNIAIVGAGITGISTALELARDGHQVTVYEQMNAAAEDASFAPGGWLSPSAALSLSTPGAGMPLKLLQNAAGWVPNSAWPGSFNWRWLRQWKRHEKQALKHCDHTLSVALHTLSAYSQELRWQDQVDTELVAERKTGSMIVLRNAKELDFWGTHLDKLQAQGATCTLLETAQARTLEPGLGQDIAWTHAVHFPQGESINPRLWTHYLRAQALDMGVAIHTGHTIQAVHNQPVGVRIAGQLHKHDAVVLCTGTHQSLLAQPTLPLMPVWGYSVTAPVRDALLAPRNAIMDWQQQATISRMGQRVRISAGLEMGGNATATHHAPTVQRMYQLLNDWFPGGVQLSSPQVQVWRGARGHLPDSLPAVGRTNQPGIWVNVAHGSHGASLAAGCARALADLIAGRKTALDMQAFNPQRF
jgi:D-amino-acid dehydrogenase